MASIGKQLSQYQNPFCIPLYHCVLSLSLGYFFVCCGWSRVRNSDMGGGVNDSDKSGVSYSDMSGVCVVSAFLWHHRLQLLFWLCVVFTQNYNDNPLPHPPPVS